MKKQVLPLKWLQLFAEGGEGEAGSATSGDGAPDAGVQALLDLRVPKDKIRKNRRYDAKTQPVPESAPAAGEGAETFGNPPPEEGEQPSRMSWEEILADPEYNRAMQATVQARLRDAKGKAEALDKLTPALEELARRQGMDPERMVYDALAKTLVGQPPAEPATRKGAEDDGLRREFYRSHIQGLERQAQALQAVFPDFDLRQELQNPAFARLTAPGVGLSVEDAYYALHRRELTQRSMQVAARKTAEQISSAIQSGSRRPQEAGTSAQAPSVAVFDYAKASKAQREELKRRIRAGERVAPGQEFR